MTVLEGVSRPIAEFLSSLGLGTPEDLQTKVEGFLWLIIILLGIVFAIKLYRMFK